MPTDTVKQYEETDWTLPENTYYHSAREVAKFLGVSRMQLYRWIKLHPFPDSFYNSDYIHLYYRTVCVNQVSVRKWVKKLLEKHGVDMSWKTLQGLRKL